MLATGGLLMAVAVLTLTAVAPVFRGDNPPRWATRGWVGELVTLAIVCTLAVGVGYLGAGAIDAVQTGPDYVDFGLLALVLGASVMIWRRLRTRARPQVVEADASLHVLAPGARQAHSPSLAATPQSARVSASKPAPPHKAA